MEDLARPNPDELLTRIQAEEQAQHRGRLTIFLGYAAGVGKTYAMLEAAHQRREEGVDVVVGYVETHGRIETKALLRELEILPQLVLSYRGINLSEMDIDRVLARRPELVLVDELAHSNVPGSRHSKRHQDVEELMAAGIHVYTTLNIQHLESLNDVIAQITGITVHETVPDRVIDEVSEIILIDLPPDDLLQRLNDGKVYVSEQAAQAIQKFFRKGNLTALRELTLRRAAERVDDQMRAYMVTKAISGPWAAAERLLVCIGPSPLAERLIRSTRRLADELNAEWHAIYIETPGHARLTQTQRDQIAQALLLAEELGGKSVTLPGQSVSSIVMTYARKHNFTKVIAGKPSQPKWKELTRGSIVDQLIKQSGNIDVYVISGDYASPSPIQKTSVTPHRPFSRYLSACILVLAATIIGAALRPILSAPNLQILYLLAVLIAAAYLGRGPSILTSILSVIAFDYFFVPPYLTFAVSDTQYVITFLGLLIVGLVISQLTARVRDEAEAAQRRAVDTTTLYSLSRDLAVAGSLDEILKATLKHITQAFGRRAVVFLPTEKGGDVLQPYTGSFEFEPDENELGVAFWTYKYGRPAGRGTDTLSAAEARYLPLKTARGTVGVIGVKPVDPKMQLNPEQRRLLEAFASQAALAIERAQLADQARQAQLSQETEKLQTALLNSISHDLRTPLVTITGALTSLRDLGNRLDEYTRNSLVETAGEEAERLNRLVGNLLNMTRLEAGSLRLLIQPADIQDVIGSALEQLGSRIGERQILIDIPDDMPLVPLDFILMVQVLVNLLDNAVKYSPTDTPIEIVSRVSGGEIKIDIADRGSGIPSEDLNRIFNKFYRVHRPQDAAGTGLGLSICKGIVEAHGGYIAAQNRPKGGALITISLPLESEKTEQNLHG